MFGGGRRYGGQPRDPFEDMMDHVFGGSFFGPPFQQQFGGGGIFDDLSRSGTSFGMDPFFADPFFRPPFQQQQQQQQQQRSAAPQGRQGATIEEVPHGEDDWPASNHQPLVEEPDDAGGESLPRSRAGAEASSRGNELLPRSRSDALSDSWLGGGGGSFSTMQRSSFGPGGGYSKSTTTRRGPGGTVEIEEVTRDGDVQSVKTTHRIGDKGRTTVRTTDATGVEETRETLHGLTKSEAQAFDAEWEQRGGPGNPGPAEQQRCPPGWLRLPGFGGGGGDGSSRGGGSGGGSAGASGGGSRNITIA